MRVKTFLWSCVIIAASSFASPADAEFVYRHKTVDVAVVPDTCDIPWGGSLTNGEDIVAYEKQSVPHTETCSFETRVCRDGQLSGSFTQSLCTVQPIPVCGSEGQSGLDCINGTKTTAISHGVQTLQWNGSDWDFVSVSCDSGYKASGQTCVANTGKWVQLGLGNKGTENISTTSPCSPIGAYGYAWMMAPPPTMRQPMQFQCR